MKKAQDATMRTMITGGMRMAAIAGRATLAALPKPDADKFTWNINTEIPLTEEDLTAIESIIRLAYLRKELKERVR